MLWRQHDDPAGVFDALLPRARTITGNRGERMSAAADLLWEALHQVGVSWIGFYEIAREGNTHGAEPGGAMILGPHRDRPACSPIALHGACGRCWTSKRPLVVTDVAKLGEGYVACDPRDRSEVVVPCLDADGSCWGVLDGDSFEPGCFTPDDAARLAEFLAAAGLSAPIHAEPEVV